MIQFFWNFKTLSKQCQMKFCIEFWYDWSHCRSQMNSYCSHAFNQERLKWFKKLLLQHEFHRLNKNGKENERNVLERVRRQNKKELGATVGWFSDAKNEFYGWRRSTEPYIYFPRYSIEFICRLFGGFGIRICIVGLTIHTMQCNSFWPCVLQLNPKLDVGR